MILTCELDPDIVTSMLNVYIKQCHHIFETLC